MVVPDENDSPLRNDGLETEILDVLKRHPNGTWVEQIARELKKNRATVKAYIMRLDGERKIRVVKEGGQNRIYLRR